MIDEMIGMGTPEELDNFKNSVWWEQIESL